MKKTSEIQKIISKDKQEKRDKVNKTYDYSITMPVNYNYMNLPNILKGHNYSIKLHLHTTEPKFYKIYKKIS
ncbi:hypothetical protein LCGC14_1881700 [marine sediment metagenome]|uniref:Uncharacterized protein n=1 Tax=marine sediment metagenome TaxID=412755 RepID=A0A0F9G260_9ZZZZ